MSIVIKGGTPTSFHAPPINTTLYTDGRKTYYTANMENVEGVLPVTHGGTGAVGFKEDEVLIYSKGKFISAGITVKELATLSGLASSGSGQKDAPTIIELLQSKVSTISTADGVSLDMDKKTGNVKLPDYLLRTGGTIEGNLQVNGSFAVGNVTIAHDKITDCITFKLVE